MQTYYYYDDPDRTYYANKLPQQSDGVLKHLKLPIAVICGFVGLLALCVYLVSSWMNGDPIKITVIFVLAMLVAVGTLFVTLSVAAILKYMGWHQPHQTAIPVGAMPSYYPPQFDVKPKNKNIPFISNYSNALPPPKDKLTVHDGNGGSIEVARDDMLYFLRYKPKNAESMRNFTKIGGSQFANLRKCAVLLGAMNRNFEWNPQNKIDGAIEWCSDED